MKRTILFLFAAIFGISALEYTEPKLTSAQAWHRRFAPEKGVEHFALGYKDPLADSLWLRVLQHMSSCGDKPHKRHTGPSVSQAKDPVQFLLTRKHPKSQCRLGWVYQMIDRITDAAPKFRLAYIAGATSLSVLVEDREGAWRIFQKGLKEFPHDWQLEYRASYHALYEMGDAKDAAKLLIEAAQDGGPAWCYSLAAKIDTVEGEALLGRQVLLDALKSNPTGYGADRIKKRLHEIDAILARQKQAH